MTVNDIFSSILVISAILFFIVITNAKPKP